MNAFGALTNDEYQKYYLGFKMPASGVLEGEVATFDNAALPDSWDWNQKGAVTPVKNQQQCGNASHPHSDLRSHLRVNSLIT